MHLTRPLPFGAFTLLLTLPWLWPSTWGPLTNAVPWMVSAACGLQALLLCNLLKPAERMLGVVLSLITAAGISALLALLQWFNLEGSLSPWVAQANPGMAYGNLRQPNQLASLLALGLWASLWLKHQIQKPSRWHKHAWLLYAALITSALVATASRVGTLHLLLMAILCGVWWLCQRQQEPRSLRWPLLSCLAIGLTAIWSVLLPMLEGMAGATGQRDLLDRIGSTESTCGSRRLLWANVLHLIALKPWAGWGWGNLDWAHYMAFYPADRFCHILDNAHNLPLHLAVELGVPIALGICLLFVAFILRQKPWRETSPDRKMAWGALLVIATHSLVEYPLWYGPFQLITLITLANLLTPPNFQIQARTRAMTCFIGMLVLSYVAWDYWRISQIFLPNEKRSSFFSKNTLDHAKNSTIFRSTVEFAEFSITPITPKNAQYMLHLGLNVLHYSPEPNVVQKIIQSAEFLNKHDLIQNQMTRFSLAYPKDFKIWLSSKNIPKSPDSLH